MYQKFEGIMSNWNLNNIKVAVDEAKQAEEDETIKILMIGNSHGIDATRQLNEVFKAAAPGKKVVIGALYHSGCRIDQHMTYINNNEGNYIYYKVDQSMTNWSRLPEHKVENGVLITGEQSNGQILGGVTLNYALVDEQWDFITLQQMSTHAAYDGGAYNFDQLDDLIDYVRSNATGTPKLYWFDTWAHPNDDIRVATYIGAGYGSRWYQQHVELFGLSQHTMYNMLIDNVKDTILPRVKSGKLDGVIDSATAVQYAQDVLGLPEYQVFRDGTHISDFGRLMVACLWYSTFTGDSLTVNDIPSNIIQNTSSYPYDQKVTAEMKQDIVEVLTYVMDSENQFKLPAGTVEAERITYADTKNGLWKAEGVNGSTYTGIVADLYSEEKFVEFSRGELVSSLPPEEQADINPEDCVEYNGETYTIVAGDFAVVESVATAKDNTVTVTLETEAKIELDRTGENAMVVATVSEASLAEIGIVKDLTFTFHAAN